jgi:integrase
MAAYLDEERKQWRWRKQIIVRGKPVRGSGTPDVNTKRAAEAEEAAWITKASEGGPLRSGEVPTVDKVVESYLAHVQMHRSSALHANRVSAFKAHLSPWFGPTRLDQIGPGAIDKYKAAKLKVPLAPGTINGHVLGLTNLLRWAVTRGHLAEVPKVELLPDPDSSDVEHLEDADLAAIIEGASGDLQTMIIVAANTGLRASELLALQWKDLDLKAQRMVVRHNVYRGEDRPPKGKRERVVPLNATAIAALKAHQHLRSHLVFCHMDGAPIPYSTALYRLQEHAGVAGWHVLRHTFGTRLSAKGVPLRAIQEWMGHASIKTTMIYAHFSRVMNDMIGVLDAETRQPGAKPKTGSRKG